MHLSLIKEAKKRKESEPSDDDLPKLWILTPTLSDRILEGMGAKSILDEWSEGVYVMPSSLKTGIVVIHQLPQTPETLRRAHAFVSRRFSASRSGLDY